jgi:hypothetical protein
MVRNLGMENILLSLPTRSDQCTAGPDEDSLMAMARINIGTNIIISRSKAKIKSKNLFTLWILSYKNEQFPLFLRQPKKGFRQSSCLIHDESAAREPVNLPIACESPVILPAKEQYK